MDKVGQRIKAIREQKNWTQDGVAYAAGISQPALSKIEQGLSMPKFNTLCRLAKSLGVGVHEFFPPTSGNEILGTTSLLGKAWFHLRRWWVTRNTKPFT